MDQCFQINEKDSLLSNCIHLYYGWVPIALGAETPYGKWQTELDFLWTEDAGLGTIADY